MGYVYWVTGLSGAGKTTVGSKLYEYLHKVNTNIVLLDGDVLRDIFKCYDYSYEGRKNLGYQYARLCKMLNDQGLDIIICTVVMFEEIRRWNRNNIQNYREIYLEVDIEELIRRDKKGLYSAAKEKREGNVPGINMNVELPLNADITIHNYGVVTPDKAVEMIVDYYALGGIGVNEKKDKLVYMCFAADILHGGHFLILKKAAMLGKLIVGVLTDEVVASYKRYPLLPYEERKILFENIECVYKVVKQDTLSYKKIIEELKPDYVVHGDDWNVGFERPLRDEVELLVSEYGGQIVEFPYSYDAKYEEIERRARAELSLPDYRRGRLKKILTMKGFVTAMEAHDGLTGLIVEKTSVTYEGKNEQFDSMWISSLCDSTAKGKPDIELVDMTSRFRTIEDIMEVTTKPIIFDGDTGGQTSHFGYTVRTLERMGVSMIIIEDKVGLKKNSLFGTEVEQKQDSIEHFCRKIQAGKKAQRTADFMICARIESLILEKGEKDALERANAYVNAGADAIMIHSRKKSPDEVLQFLDAFRRDNQTTPVVVVPTSYNSIKEDILKAHGANIVIYANHLIRASFPAMERVAKKILFNHRSLECDEECMPIKEIITLIPDEI